ncbi:MAG TPA: hypothetical protein VJT67_01970, partial [Longimicrobiaceae bacterium]|nr:hypothetical protein [Longimicrobiaceae bacterium]
MQPHHRNVPLARSSAALALTAALALGARPALPQASVQVLELGVARGARIVLVARGDARASGEVRLQPRTGDGA